MTFEIVKFMNFFEYSELGIFKIFGIENFSIFQIGNSWNCPNWKINKFLDFFNLKNQNLAPKIDDFGIICPSEILHYLQFYFANSHICPLI